MSWGCLLVDVQPVRAEVHLLRRPGAWGFVRSSLRAGDLFNFGGYAPGCPGERVLRVLSWTSIRGSCRGSSSTSAAAFLAAR
eukprot:620686-Heterocapsa_arctica.AAC.1